MDTPNQKKSYNDRIRLRLLAHRGQYRRSYYAIRSADEVAKLMCLSRQAVLQIERRAIWKLSYRLREFWKQYNGELQ
jgi:hypothetical protein